MNNDLTFLQESIDDRSTKYQLFEKGRLLTYREVLEKWQQSDEFILFFASILQHSPFQGYFWEVKPVTLQLLEETFEFVLIESSSLPKVAAQVSAYQAYFHQDSLVVSFPNLRKDAMLVVPVPVTEEKFYSHLASFMRNVPRDQLLAFWRVVGAEMGKAIGTEKRWLSTHGLGVYWLHVRIDSRPKYYHFLPYK
jgi:hypothetical protein